MRSPVYNLRRLPVQTQIVLVRHDDAGGFTLAVTPANEMQLVPDEDITTATVGTR